MIHHVVYVFIGIVALCLTLLPREGLAQITVTNLETPYSFVSSTSGKEYFISSVNGDPESADNNGFITKLDATGKLLNLKFIQGGKEGVILNAPKGMALVEQTLYVADLDTLRAFDMESGKSLGSVAVASTPGQSQAHLTDVAYDGAGMLYCSDQHGNRIYRVELPSRKVTLLVADPALAGPAGLAVHPKSGDLIAVSWEKGKIFSITPKGAVSEVFSNGFFSGRFTNLRGVDFDRWGNMYVSDFTTGKVWRMTWDKRFQVIAEYLPSPGDLGIDRTNNLILVPYEFAHAAEMNGLEAPSEGKSKQEKRTLADYGFIPPPAKPQEGGAKK
jgi:DNA-binding beta-propeller fold protein YncE